MHRALLVLAALLAAGCLGGGAQPTSTPRVPEAAPSPAPQDANATPNLREVPLAFDGRYPNAAYACQAAISCKGVESGPYANDLKVKDLRGNLTAVHLTMTWQASGPTMETLGLAVMAMFPRDCKTCNSTEFALAKGKSPLKLDATGLQVPIDPRGVLHVYFYPFNAANDPVAVEADAETSVRVQGSAQLLSP